MSECRGKHRCLSKLGYGMLLIGLASYRDNSSGLECGKKKQCFPDSFHLCMAFMGFCMRVRITASSVLSLSLAISLFGSIAVSSIKFSTVHMPYGFSASQGPRNPQVTGRRVFLWHSMQVSLAGPFNMMCNVCKQTPLYLVMPHFLR